MKAVNVILSLLVSALMGIAVFEGGLRLIGKGPQPSVLEPHEKLGWAKKKNTSITRKTAEGFSVTYDFNEYGLRDDAEMTSEKPADTFRIVCLGDSFTMGFTVEQEDLFVDVLEDWYGREGRQVEIVNAGTEGYSTDQEAAWLLEYGDAFDPDLVLVFPYENDIYWNAQRAYFGDEKPMFDASGELETGILKAGPGKSFFARTAIGNLFAKNPVPAVFTPAGHDRPIMKEWAPLLKEAPDFLADALARTGGALTALQRKCQELDCALVVAPIPSHSAIDPEFAKIFGAAKGPLQGLGADQWSADQPVDLLLAAARGAGIATIDPRAFLRAEFKSGGEDLYFTTDWHLNPAGNRALAAFLHDELDKASLMPGAATPIAAADLTPVPDDSLPTWAYVFGSLWAIVGVSFSIFYRREENPLLGFLKVGALLGVIFTIAIGGGYLIGLLPPFVAQVAFVLIILAIVGFILWKLGDRIGTITELITAMVSRGHWYLMPLVVILLTVGSLLVVAASSPLAAPFIYTLF